MEEADKNGIETTRERTMGGVFVFESVFTDPKLADVTPGWGDTIDAAEAALLENLKERRDE